ncbi:MAG: fused MFS/spermidine synthase, partial [Deltaproteobacteria bacterium]|nr:fused MFS/spermidine synthase [Deltaproteobacteria bacterium]
LGDRIRNVTILLLSTQIVAALSALLMSQVMGNSQIFFAKLIYHFKDNFAQLSLLKAFILFAFMFLPTIFLGAAFPLVAKICTRSLSRAGRSIGYAYAVNSIGAVLGSFCAGFVLIPLIGKEQGLSLVVAIQLLTVFITGVHIFRKRRAKATRWIPILVPALLGLILVFIYPHWDRKMLSVGKYHRYKKSTVINAGWMKTLFYGTEINADQSESEILYFGDGIGGFTTVMKREIDILGNENIVMYNSGKPDASSRLDMDTQTLSGHLPLLFHEDPGRVLVIGLASGITAGEILLYPINNLDAVEISRQVVFASNLFRPWNNNVLSDPRTDLIIQDGRAHLELTDRKYDVISSEPSNPWMAGLSTLFTEEFFSLAKNRLNLNGIFVQFIHTYQMDWSTFAMVGRTFAHVFPNSLLVRTNPSSVGPDFLLVGFNGDRTLAVDTAARNLHFTQKSQNISLLNHRLFHTLIISEDLQRLFGNGPINTDDRPRLEFLAPKLMHLLDLSIVKNLMANYWLSRETVAVVDEFFSNIDSQIDLVAYALPFIKKNMPFQFPVDLSQSTLEQRERFSRLMEEYCANNIVKDFSLLGDEVIKKRCINVQIKAVLDRLDKIDTTQNKESLSIHLRNLYAEREK